MGTRLEVINYRCNHPLNVITFQLHVYLKSKNQRLFLSVGWCYHYWVALIVIFSKLLILSNCCHNFNGGKVNDYFTFAYKCWYLKRLSYLCDVKKGVLQLTKVGFQLNRLTHFLGVTFILEKKKWFTFWNQTGTNYINLSVNKIQNIWIHCVFKFSINVEMRHSNEGAKRTNILHL